jgi:hypothetical protein
MLGPAVTAAAWLRTSTLAGLRLPVFFHARLSTPTAIIQLVNAAERVVYAAKSIVHTAQRVTAAAAAAATCGEFARPREEHNLHGV